MEFTQQKALKSLSSNFIKSVGLKALFSMRTAIHQPPIFDRGLGIGPPTRCQRGQLWPMAERYCIPHTAIPAKEPGAERPLVSWLITSDVDLVGLLSYLCVLLLCCKGAQ